MMAARWVRASALLLLAGALACDDDGPGVLEPLGDDERRIALDLVAEGLISPITLVEAPDGSGRLYVVDQIGLVRMIDADGTLLPQPFLDVRGRMTPLNADFDERGLLGLAFHPSFRQRALLRLLHGAAACGRAGRVQQHRAISEFRVVHRTPGAERDAGSERIVLQVDHPQANHNGGTVAFGPRRLPVHLDRRRRRRATTTSAGPRAGLVRGQRAAATGRTSRRTCWATSCASTWTAARRTPFRRDNPFVGGPGLDEIWAYGFRNPYRFSFDMGGTHTTLLVGDAGQELWEEVSLVTRGGNYGWNVKEGTHCFDAEAPTVVAGHLPDRGPDDGRRRCATR